MFTTPSLKDYKFQSPTESKFIGAVLGALIIALIFGLPKLGFPVKDTSLMFAVFFSIIVSISLFVFWEISSSQKFSLAREDMISMIEDEGLDVIRGRNSSENISITQGVQTFYGEAHGFFVECRLVNAGKTFEVLCSSPHKQEFIPFDLSLADAHQIRIHQARTKNPSSGLEN